MLVLLTLLVKVLAVNGVREEMSFHAMNFSPVF